MESKHPGDELLKLSADTFAECHRLIQCMAEDQTTHSTTKSSLSIAEDNDVVETRSRLLGLLGNLTRLVQGPREYLHELISTNWDCGALYTALEFDIFSRIPLESSVSLETLSTESHLPTDKLSRILRLLVCHEILNEVEPNTFSHTALSEILLKDPEFSAYVGFQLFETRVASAHLSDSLKLKPNSFSAGKSAFRYAWGQEMYDWHAGHQEKQTRFRSGMRGVSKFFDPGNQLLLQWFEQWSAVAGRKRIVEIGGQYGYASGFLAEAFEQFSFTVTDNSGERLENFMASLTDGKRGRTATRLYNGKPSTQLLGADGDEVDVYVIRNVLWNWSDENVIELLRSMLPALEKSPEALILICDGVSPDWQMFKPHVELAYRRRDVTMMTMHNVKQRTRDEWLSVIASADSRLQVNVTHASSSHVHKGVFAIRIRVPETVTAEVIREEGNGLV